MNPQPIRRIAAAAAILIAIVAVGACKNPGTSQKDKPLPVKANTEAQQLVKAYADDTATALGAPLTNYSAISAACEGKRGETATDGRYDISGHAQIPVTEGTHVNTLERIRDLWQAKGYEIVSLRTFPDGATGALSAHNPADDIQISLESTKPPTAMTLLILTPCYIPR